MTKKAEPKSARRKTTAPKKSNAEAFSFLAKLQTMTDRANASADREVMVRQLKDIIEKYEQGGNETIESIRARQKEEAPLMIRLARINQRTGLADPDEAHYMIELYMNDLMDDVLEDPEIVAIFAKMKAIEKREGLDEDHYWPPGEGPDDYEELRKAEDDRYEAIFVKRLRDFGEHDMADLYLTDRDEYRRRTERGRRICFPDSPSLEELMARRQAEADGQDTGS